MSKNGLLGASKLLLCALFLGGCSDDAGSNPGASHTGGSGTTEGQVLLVGQVFTPDNYNTYVGVLPDVPEGHVSFSRFREFGNANAYTHAGYVFVEEDGKMKRFSVGDDLELIDGPEFSWQDFGVASINASYTVFVSNERAYTLAPELGVVVVWNPERMEYEGTLPAKFPERPADMETWAYDGYLVGDKVFWNIFSGDFAALTVYPAVTLAVADAHSDAEVRFIEDDRCLPGGPSRVDENGDYEVQGGGYFGFFYAYGGVPDAKTCMLRVRAGDTEPEPDFALDYRDLTGSYVNDAWIHVRGAKSISRIWDADAEFPEDSEEFWNNPALRAVLIDTEAGTTEPYPDLQGVIPVDGTTREVDGVSYFQVSETGYVAGGNTAVVELHPDGIKPRFSLDGFLLGLERIR